MMSPGACQPDRTCRDIALDTMNGLTYGSSDLRGIIGDPGNRHRSRTLCANTGGWPMIQDNPPKQQT
jgi:hypothetical protein